MKSGFSSEVDVLNIQTLQSQLGTRFFGVGDRIVYVPIVDSTNTLAMHLALEGSEEGVVVLTDSQTAGKGRQGRRWVDVFGRNVLSSTLLRPLFPSHLLVMVASLSVMDAIRETCGLSANIKWPNDVFIGNRKVAGILIETSHDSTGRMVAILGIGVNVNGHIQDLSEDSSTQEALPAPLTRTATTLEMECGYAVSRELFIAHLLQHIETDYLALQQEAQESTGTFSRLTAAVKPVSRLIRERWRSQLSTLGRSVQVRQGNTIISGIAEDVDDNGELLLRRHSGELVSITWGDVGYPAG